MNDRDKGLMGLGLLGITLLIVFIFWWGDATEQERQQQGVLKILKEDCEEAEFMEDKQAKRIWQPFICDLYEETKANMGITIDEPEPECKEIICEPLVLERQGEAFLRVAKQNCFDELDQYTDEEQENFCDLYENYEPRLSEPKECEGILCLRLWA